METNIDQSDKTPQELETKKPGFFQRFRRGFTSIFCGSNNRKGNKRDSHVEKPESAPNVNDTGNLSSSLLNEETPAIVDDTVVNKDPVKSIDANLRASAKVPVLVNDFTSELKQSLQLRSRKIEEGEKSPTEVIKQIEGFRTLSSIVNEEKEDVKIEIESKTFGEKLALFESQISGGSGSVQDTLRREDKSDQVDNDGEEENNDENMIRGSDEEDCGDFLGLGETNYTIDMVEDHSGEDDKEVENGMTSGELTERYVVNESGDSGFETISEIKESDSKMERITNGTMVEETGIDDEQDHIHEEVAGFVKELINNATEAMERKTDHDSLASANMTADV